MNKDSRLTIVMIWCYVRMCFFGEAWCRRRSRSYAANSWWVSCRSPVDIRKTDPGKIRQIVSNILRFCKDWCRISGIGRSGFRYLTAWPAFGVFRGQKDRDLGGYNLTLKKGIPLTDFPADTPDKQAEKQPVLLKNQHMDPLHGVTLETVLAALLVKLGWEGMAAHVPIRCFSHDPSMASSLKFLRKTPWARNKVEALYVSLIEHDEQGNRGA